MKILYYCPFDKGGLFDYGRAQVRALGSVQGVEPIWLGCPSRDAFEPPAKVSGAGLLDARPDRTTGSTFMRAFRFIQQTNRDYARLRRAIKTDCPDSVLFASYAEYLAPLWASKLRRQSGSTRFGAVVHDPVRDYRVGPEFWHRRSIASAYSVLDVAYVHEPCALDTVDSFPDLRTVVIPHGLYEFETKHLPKREARDILKLPPDATVFLAFGHIRDGKNLDLFLQSMPGFPEVHLVVAGLEQSAGQKPATFYKELAERLGVSDRVRWHIRHIPESETGVFFGAADYLVLTYSAAFRSASGVLASAAQFGVPVLASGGEGPFKTSVEKYRLGRFVSPDDSGSITAGARELMANASNPDWDGFRRDHSWARNAELVVESLRKRS